MTLEKIYEMGLIKDNTEIFVRQGEGFHVLAHGNWYQDDVLNYMHHEIESFTWQDDNKLYIDVKEAAEKVDTTAYIWYNVIIKYRRWHYG